MDEMEYQSRVQECLQSLYRVAYSILLNNHDCADAVQEAIFQGWIKRQQLRDASLFKPWLTRIVVNECRNFQRRAMKQLRVVEAVANDIRLRPEEGRQDQRRMEIEAALAELPEKYRLPIVLYYMEGYPTNTIAKMLSIPESRLRERMRVARKRMEKVLNHEIDE